MPDVTTWEVRAFASWAYAPLALLDDPPALEAFTRHSVDQLREAATDAGHRLLPVDNPIVNVEAVYVSDDPEDTGWVGVGPTYRHNALRILTEIRVGYNPDVAARELGEILAAREPEEEYEEKVGVIATLCLISILTYGAAMIFATDGKVITCAVLVGISMTALAAAYLRDKAARHPAPALPRPSRVGPLLTVLGAVLVGSGVILTAAGSPMSGTDLAIIVTGVACILTAIIVNHRESRP